MLPLVLLLMEVVRSVDALRWLRRTRVLLMLLLLRAALAAPAAAARAGRAICAKARRIIEPVVVVWGILGVCVCKDEQTTRLGVGRLPYFMHDYNDF